MPGPVTTLGSPLNVSGGGSAAGASGSQSIVGDLDNLTGQVGQQTQQFGQLLQDPNFTGSSEMASMLKLQRAISQETMIYQTVSNTLKARTDATKGAVQNLR
jgi:hypothetical protein